MIENRILYKYYNVGSVVAIEQRLRPLALASLSLLASNVCFAQDWYSKAYSAYSKGQRSEALRYLREGTKESNPQNLRAECYHFSGLLAKLDGKAQLSQDLYASGIALGAGQSTLPKDVYDSSLRADYVAKSARIIPSQCGAGVTLLQAPGAGVSGKHFYDDYFKSDKGKRTRELIGHTPEGEGIEDFLTMYREEIFHTMMYKGYLVISIRTDLKNRLYSLIWKVDERVFSSWWGDD